MVDLVRPPLIREEDLRSHPPFHASPVAARAGHNHEHEPRERRQCDRLDLEVVDDVQRRVPRDRRRAHRAQTIIGRMRSSAPDAPLREISSGARLACAARKRVVIVRRTVAVLAVRIAARRGAAPDLGKRHRAWLWCLLPRRRRASPDEVGDVVVERVELGLDGVDHVPRTRSAASPGLPGACRGWEGA